MKKIFHLYIPNRGATSSRETLLKIAIEMADAAAFERLIVLGADAEQYRDYVPSAALTQQHSPT